MNKLLTHRYKDRRTLIYPCGIFVFTMEIFVIDTEKVNFYCAIIDSPQIKSPVLTIFEINLTTNPFVKRKFSNPTE